ncbi:MULTISPECIES: FAD-binding domain-containing protein [unclassified Rhodococcus (in: high G+C Gram-positive bacteria)]|uniref:FAD-binding domain-containing protein n=1 Tax=unclassified Rhodococcus (in: high G+C Gram-positive bacteria) TaxID=192944 RepID=UPI000B9AFDC6|nr:MULTISPECIES: FAD-binding domain-containing protein [unclassified Rhodococcus (in: high G+C Gram-positive bacteria)]OZE42220.1 deoxyribodipyrimidine photolyase [Rhodococcus sp. 05-2254-4]OZE49850.1 deoxyribodipyrimidine photolyase [Rhodococcus sp. 05-2254-3]OZE50488.1 deoxyribodipyrimidine photolyase [Rhodococcus sp. 05-2254-2]
MSELPPPPSIADGAATDDVVAWVAEHLGDLAREGADGVTAGAIRGGQSAADTALAGLDITGYARDRSTVLPVNRRGASRMSPYIRHGLLTLREVWDAVADAPSRDRSRYRDELMWQEYARHLYARVGTELGQSLRREQPRPQGWTAQPWPEEMNCMSSVVGELHDDGWLVNQTRMWLASQWAVRAGATWRDGEDEMFAHLLDGSRAANRLGWQWTVGTGSGKVYGFSRWQVNKRAPSLCRNCALNDACPIENWPDDDLGPAVDGPDLNKAPIPAGPAHVEGQGAEQVWITAESLGTADPALAAQPDRAAVFVFDEPLLRKLRLSGKRLVFLAETLGEIASTRPLEVRRGRVADELSERAVATTWAPVPGFSRIADAVAPVELHPWPWLVRPTTSSVRSFSAWRRSH